MSTAAWIGLIALLLFYFAWREYRHDRERQDLYTRLMAKDLTEYQTNHQLLNAKNRPPPRKRHLNFVRAGVERYLNEKLGDA